MMGDRKSAWIPRWRGPVRTPLSVASVCVLATCLTVLPGKAWASTPVPDVLDPNRNYGNIYAGKLLPVGDGKSTTEGARKGYVFSCKELKSNQGAHSKGPWFKGNEYDPHAKVKVDGNNTWTSQAKFENKAGPEHRALATNALPGKSTIGEFSTGDFPIAPKSDAAQYDRNPNYIKPQSIKYSLPMSPKVGEPKCVDLGEVGILLSGVTVDHGLDAQGRDAGAWETLDKCEGHPGIKSEYHIHTLSACVKDRSVRTVLGFALDGFPITGPSLGPGNILTTKDLDICHGIISEVILDGKKVTTYHYVMTQDFPYTVSCYRGTSAKGKQMQSGGGQNKPKEHRQVPDGMPKPPSHPGDKPPPPHPGMPGWPGMPGGPKPPGA